MPASAYKSERKVAVDTILHDVVTHEVYHQYMQPLFYDKLKTWGVGSLEAPYTDTRNTLDVFIGLHEALTLTADEYTCYKNICKNAIAKRHLWICASYIDEQVEDLCCNYMLCDSYHDTLWDCLENIKTKFVI